MKNRNLAWISFVVILLLLPIAARSQARGSPVAYRINYGAAVPATCQVATGDVFYVNAGANLGLYQCTAANTWTTVGASGAGSIFLGGPGAVGGPTYSFLADPDTGLYNTGANQLGFSTTGINRLNINAAAGVDATIPFRGPNGGIGAPTFSFTGDPDTGIYSPGGGIIGFNTNGALRADIDATRISLQAPLALHIEGVAFAALGVPANGTIIYCNDCTITNPCAGAGTGALAKRLNGVWVCN